MAIESIWIYVKIWIQSSVVLLHQHYISEKQVNQCIRKCTGLKWIKRDTRRYSSVKLQPAPFSSYCIWRTNVAINNSWFSEKMLWLHLPLFQIENYLNLMMEIEWDRFNDNIMYKKSFLSTLSPVHIIINVNYEKYLYTHKHTWYLLSSPDRVFFVKMNTYIQNTKINIILWSLKC